MDQTLMRVRANDPITSVMAAEGAEKFAGSHVERITMVLERCGQGTALRIAEAANLTVVQVDRRLPEMQRAGRADVVKVEDGSDMVVDGYRVWRLTKKAS